MKHITMIWVFIVILTGQQYTDAFLRIGVYPRSIGVGQAVAALTENNSGSIINPAAIGFINSTNLSVMYINQFGMADYIAASINHSWRQFWQTGISMVNLSIDNIPDRPDLRRILDLETRRDSIRTLTSRGFSTFRDRETGIFFTLTRNLSTTLDLGWHISPFEIQLPVGLNIKMIHKDLYDLSGNGIGIDLGSMLSFNLADVTGADWMGNLTLGLALTDITGTLIYWSSGKNDRIDPALISGMGYRHTFRSFPVEMVLLVQSRSADSIMDFGFEFIFKDIIALRIGNRQGEIQGGLGLHFPVDNRPISVDYSFNAHNLGDAHRIGGSITF